MVLAIAALFLNLTQLSPLTSNNFAPATKSEIVTTKSARATSGAEENSAVPDNSEAAKFSLDKVTLTGTSSTKDAPKLSAVSMNTTETSQALSTIRIPEANSGKGAEVTTAETRPYTRQWLALSLVQHGAAAFDAYSTREAVSRGAVEDDPMMRPFAHSDALYAAIQAGPLMLDYIARRMQHSENGFIRKMWWMPQSASTAGFLISGVHNLHVASRE